ncbi:MAG: hypothetical protein EWM47_02640 [Anaerolineaceae bacterium]|nr:MAG: hypothetical protein EWM47_02640 [Anaerolineaceae bacterium]
MRSSRGFKRIATMLAALCALTLMTATVFAATTEIVKDGAFQNVGFINAGAVVDGTIQGPGNWTQLNLGDASIDSPYLHIIMKATGDTGAAQIVVSDKYTVNLADLGITLSEEYQDVVLPVGEQSLDMLSWVNFMGLDGGSSVYTIKDIFLSDDANPTIEVEEADVEEAPVEDADVEEPVETEAPKTGDSGFWSIITMIGIAGCALILAKLKRVEQA